MLSCGSTTPQDYPEWVSSRFSVIRRIARVSTIKGVLSIFPAADDGDFSEASMQALEAALEGLERLSVVNKVRRETNRTEVRIGIGLHVGESWIDLFERDDLRFREPARPVGRPSHHRKATVRSVERNGEIIGNAEILSFDSNRYSGISAVRRRRNGVPRSVVPRIGLRKYSSVAS